MALFYALNVLNKELRQFKLFKYLKALHIFLMLVWRVMLYTVAYWNSANIGRYVYYSKFLVTSEILTWKLNVFEEICCWKYVGLHDKCSDGHGKPVGNLYPQCI